MHLTVKLPDITEPCQRVLAQVPQLGRWIRRKISGHFCAKFLDHTATGMLSKFCVELSSISCVSFQRAQLRNLGLNFLFPSFCLGCGDYLTGRGVPPRPVTPAQAGVQKNNLCGGCDCKLKNSWRDARHIFDGFKHLERLYVFGPYREEPLTTLIHKTKYENKEWALGPIFKELPHFASQQELPSFIDRVIPIPLHQSRLRQRGFNQAELIAREMAQILNKPLMTKALRRHRATKPQTEMKLDKERAQNIKDAFSLDPAGQFIDLKGQKILLVDDVATTGATLQECAKPLKKLGAQVYGFALAH